VIISRLYLHSAMVPLALISATVSGETRASACAVSYTSTRTFAGGE